MSFVYVESSHSARTVNNKIRWTGYTSFAHITCGNIKMVSNVHGEANEVREERLRRRRECYRLRRERETREERHARFIKL